MEETSQSFTVSPRLFEFICGLDNIPFDEVTRLRVENLWMNMFQRLLQETALIRLFRLSILLLKS